MLKEIIIAIQAYSHTHSFIIRHRLWKWILIPGLIYTLLFCVCIYLFAVSSHSAIEFIKYLFLIIGSPLFAYLSEKTESIIEGKEFPLSFKQLMKDILRGIRLALRNMLWQTVYTISILVLSFIPVIGWVTPLLALLIECYYLGFSMLDYSCERNKLSTTQSIGLIGRHKGLAIGNGIVFYLMHLIPVLGWLFAPSYAVIAATISLYKAKTEGLINISGKVNL